MFKWMQKKYILFEGPKAYLKEGRWKGLRIFISTKKISHMQTHLYMWILFVEVVWKCDCYHDSLIIWWDLNIMDLKK